MKYSELKHVLKNHKLRITDCRMDVLEFFLDQKRALSFRDLEDKFQDYDRVTLYRTLNSFTDHGLLHKIPDDSGFATYGLCQGCNAEQHHHNHMHFKCSTCGQMECIEEKISIPSISLPEEYKMIDMDVIITGICKQCNSI